MITSLNERMYVDANKAMLDKMDKYFALLKNKYGKKKVSNEAISLILVKIKLILEALFNISNLKIFIVKSSSLNVCVWYSEKDIEAIAASAVETNGRKLHKKCRNIVIEVSDEFITSNKYSNRDLTAIMLHEIGHMVYNSDTISYVQHYFNKYLSKFFLYLNKSIFPSILIIPFCTIITLFVLIEEKFRGLDVKREVLADSFAVQNGYAVEINKVLEEIQTHYQKKANKREYSRFVDLLNKMVFIRKKGIIEAVQEEIKTVESPHMKKMLEEQLAILISKNNGVLQ